MKFMKLKSKDLNKYTDSIRNQQLREINSFPKPADEPTRWKVTKSKIDNSDFNWDTLFDKLWALDTQKGLEKSEKNY